MHGPRSSAGFLASTAWPVILAAPAAMAAAGAASEGGAGPACAPAVLAACNAGAGCGSAAELGPGMAGSGGSQVRASELQLALDGAGRFASALSPND